MTPSIVLGIETSCDETAVAILATEGTGIKILGEAISSQIDVHARYGGVVPEIASREHLAALPLLCENLLAEARIGSDSLDAIGVTVGPGLKGCLLVGLVYSQAVASALSIPLVPVNHIEGHLVSHELSHGPLEAPYLALVVSGGHTELHRVEGFGKYAIIARTRDDAAGEAFDKSAALLGFPYPGGPALAALADTVPSSRFSLPKVSREMSDFSFSGLKTAVMLQVSKNRSLLLEDGSARAEMACAVQSAILETLIQKILAARRATGLTKLVVVGGVSVNRSLRARLGAEFGADVIFPAPKHCTDNGSMIALAASKRLSLGSSIHSSVEVRSRWPVEEMIL